MHRRVDAPVQQGLVQFLGEQPLAANLLQAALDAVAAGHESLDGKVGRVRAGARGKEPRHQMRVGQRQRRTAGTDAQAHFHSATGGIEDRIAVAPASVVSIVGA